MDDEIKKDEPYTPENGHASHHEDFGYSSSTSSPPKPASPNMPYRERGPLINRSETIDEQYAKKAYNAGLMWPRIRHLCRAPFSEFMGTFILIMFGDGVVAQVTLSNKDGGDYQSISWGWVSDALRMVVLNVD
jgi:aquaglyceroporin related protein, other eukaryote